MRGWLDEEKGWEAAEGWRDRGGNKSRASWCGIHCSSKPLAEDCN